MAYPFDERMTRLVEKLKPHADQIERLPGEEGLIVREALQGRSVYEIAQTHRMSEAAIWNILGNTARDVSGEPARQPTETSGLGSDTEPGVTGGYGDTAFGSLGNEPPIPAPEEPEDEAEQ